MCVWTIKWRLITSSGFLPCKPLSQSVLRQQAQKACHVHMWMANLLTHFTTQSSQWTDGYSDCSISMHEIQLYPLQVSTDLQAAGR